MIRASHPGRLLSLVVAVLVLCGMSCKKTEAQAKTKPKPLVAAVQLEPRTLEVTLEATGTVEPARIAKVASPAEGPVLGAHVREGDQVKAGQVLVSIGRQSEAIAVVATARESVALEKRNVERVERLVTIGAAAGEEAERAKLALSQAEARLAAARQGSNDHQIRAPWSGVVSRVLIADGAFVAPRQTVVELFDPASLVVRLAVPEKSALLVRKDALARVELDAHPGKHVQGVVSRVYPELDRRTRTQTVEVTVEEAGDLAPGMFARVGIVTQTVANALVVPEHTLIVSPKGESYVFVLEQSTAKRRIVETGVEVDGLVQIVSGVAGGDRVIQRGHENLKDGIEVRTGSPHPKGSASAGAGKGPEALR